VWSRHRDDRDFEAEAQAHLELLEERFAKQGLSPQQARLAARRAFGSLDRTRQLHRETRAMAWIDGLWQDARSAARTLLKSPAFVGVSVLTLGLGIGATTAVFTQIAAVFFTPLQVSRPTELRILTWAASDYSFAGPSGRRWQARGAQRVSGGSQAAYVYLSEQHAGFENVACWLGRNLSVTFDGSHDTPAVLVSGSYFATLGVPPIIGRVIVPDDDHSGAAPVAVIGERVWRRLFRADSGILGRRVRINGAVVTIVGVMPRGFFGLEPDRGIAVWMPLSLYRDAGLPFLDGDPWGGCSGMVSRLRADATVESARAQAEVLFRQAILAADPKARVDGLRVWLEDASRGTDIVRSTTAVTLPVVMAGVTVLLLIGCSSVAATLFARGLVRQREIATRLALGGSRGRVAQQLILESLILAALSALAGLVIALALTPLLPTMLAQLSVGRIGLEVTPDLRVLAFAVVLSAATGLLAGVLPAIRVTGIDLRSVMKPIGPGTPGRRGRFSGGKAMVAVQVNLSVVLLIGAGLFVQTLVNLRAGWGYTAEGLVRFGIDVNAATRPNPPEILATLERVQGVTSATASTWGVYAASDHPEQSTRVCLPGFVPRGSDDDRVGMDVIYPGFFKTWGVRLVAGAEFEPGHRSANQRVVVVNAALVDKFFPNAMAVGQTIGLGACPGAPFTIVGIAENSSNSPWAPATPLVYRVMPPQDRFSQVFAVRTAGDSARVVPDVRKVTESLGLELRSEVMTGTQIQRMNLERERLLAGLLVAFAAAALLVCCVGLYGLLTYTATRRTSEIGVRLALGAKPLDIIRAVQLESWLPVATGLVGGAVLAATLTRFVSSLLFGVAATDPWIMAAAMIVLILVAGVAAFKPTLAALRIDPVTALKYE
jgi:predicted permease